MRYSKTHKEETRRKLLDSSRALIKKEGFDATGVDTLMSAIGMTAGAFYSHFPSKDALFESVITEEVANSVAMLQAGSAGTVEQAIKNLKIYLSLTHARHPESGCVMPALGPEISRSSPEVRAIVETGLKTLHSGWSEKFNNDETAWAVLSQCVGALILARSVKTDKTRSEILEANRRYLEKLIPTLIQEEGSK